MSNSEIRFIVRGLPQTAGSKSAFPFKRKNGSLGVAVSDSNPKSKAWRSVIVDAATEAMNGGGILTGSLEVLFVFYLPRPKGHYRKNGSIGPSAPWFPVVRPDVLKLARCAEDALTGVLWRDDAQIVTETLMKRYSDCGFMEVEVKQLAAPAARGSE